MNDSPVAEDGRFGRSALTYDEEARVQRELASRLMKMSEGHIEAGGTLLEIGCGTGLLTAPLLSTMHPSATTLCDKSKAMTDVCMTKLSAIDAERTTVMVADAESAAWPRVDVVASASAVQWFAAPLTFADKAANALSHNGLLMLATYGPQTYRELRDMAPNAYPTFEAWATKLSERFEVLETFHETTVQTFKSHTERLRHIVKTGVGGDRGSQGQKHPGGAANGSPTLTYEAMAFVCRRI